MHSYTDIIIKYIYKLKREGERESNIIPLHSSWQETLGSSSLCLSSCTAPGSTHQLAYTARRTAVQLKQALLSKPLLLVLLSLLESIVVLPFLLTLQTATRVLPHIHSTSKSPHRAWGQHYFTQPPPLPLLRNTSSRLTCRPFEKVVEKYVSIHTLRTHTVRRTTRECELQCRPTNCTSTLGCPCIKSVLNINVSHIYMKLIETPFYLFVQHQYYKEKEKA